MLNTDDEGYPVAVMSDSRDDEIIYLNDQNRIKNKIVSDRIFFSFYPYVEKHQRLSMYITGSSGVGKTTYCINVAKRFHRIDSRFKIWVISPKFYNYERERIFNNIPIDDIMEDLDFTMFKNSLMIFDDIEIYLHDKQYKEKFKNFMNQILLLSRDRSIHIIITHHNLTDYSQTRTILNECKYYVLSPHDATDNQLKTLLKNYGGLSNRHISDMKKLNTRMLLFSRNYPKYILYDHGIYIIK